MNSLKFRPFLRYWMCAENKKPKQPSFIKEIYSVVKESATDTIQRTTDNIKTSATNLKSEANKQQESTVATTCYNIAKLAWRKTFPSHDDEVKAKMDRVRCKMAQQQKQREYTEEEIAQMDGEIPEWKKNAIQVTDEVGKEEKPSLRKKLQMKVSSRISQTEYAKQLKEAEVYKQMQDVRNTMTTFKDEAKEHYSNHPSNIIQGSFAVYKTVTNESATARAIRKMREIDPEFDLFELEKEAKVIFETTFNLYLQGDLKSLQKVCGEMALGYFKVMLKKFEVEKCEPKYKQLWNVDDIRFSKATFPEATKVPTFIFTIKTQEIFCQVAKMDKNKIVDGSDDRIMSMDYQFALSPHSDPALEEVGHFWEMVEIQPQMAIKMLV